MFSLRRRVNVESTTLDRVDGPHTKTTRQHMPRTRNDEHKCRDEVCMLETVRNDAYTPLTQRQRG